MAHLIQSESGSVDFLPAVLEEVSMPSLASQVSSGVIRWTNPVATPTILINQLIFSIHLSPSFYKNSYAKKQETWNEPGDEDIIPKTFPSIPRVKN